MDPAYFMRLPVQGHISPSHFGRFPRSMREAFGCEFGPIEGPYHRRGGAARSDVVVAGFVVLMLVCSIAGALYERF